MSGGGARKWVRASGVSRVLLALLVGSATLFGSGCMRFKESPWDSSTLWGLLLQWGLSRVPFALGQDNPYSVFGIERGFNKPAGMTIFGNTIYIADRDNKRVVRFSPPTANHEPASLALGQPSPSNGFQQVFNYPVSAASVDRPAAVATDGVRVAVADTLHHRVLLWLTTPTYSGQPADVVLGQVGTTGIGPATAAGRMSTPQGVAFCNNRLYVADSSNNRVLIFSPIPESTGTQATGVLGQADFVTGGAGAVGPTTLSNPSGIHCDGVRLYVADLGYNRVLIWNTAPTGISVPADVAVGAANLSVAGAGGATTTTLASPTGVFARSGGPLIIADTSNNRIIYHDSIPTISGTAANRVFGQVDFVSSAIPVAGSYDRGLDSPPSAAMDDQGRLYAVDRNQDRIAIWNKPTSSTQGARIDLVLGQPTADTPPVSHNPGSGPFRLLGPAQMTLSSDRLFLAAANQSRVLGWDSIPAFREAPASFVLGQPDFTTVANDNVIGTSAGTLDAGAGVCSNGTHLFVSDTSNNRILVWNSIPTATRGLPNFVLGQADFFGAAANAGGPTAINSLSGPAGLYCDNQRLIVADGGNHRVLLFNLPITVTQQSASLVLGQATFAAFAAAAGATGMNQPGPPPLVFDGKLFVGDTGNNRVLIWNAFPSTNGQAADLVLGQSDFSSVAANGGGTVSDRVLSTPQGLMIVRGRLFVSDFFNNRIMVWRDIPTSNGRAADYVLGQVNFTSSLPNAEGAVGPFGFFGPGVLLHTADRVYIGDLFNQRVLVLEEGFLFR